MGRPKHLQRKHIPDVVVLQAVRDRTVAQLPYPEKLVTAKLERLCTLGLLNYGVSLWTAWLEPAGREMLEELEQRLVEGMES